jgi:hypothetical protein
MNEFDQDTVNEGCLIIALLCKSMKDLADRPMDERDDLLIAAAMAHIEEYGKNLSNIAYRS